MTALWIIGALLVLLTGFLLLRVRLRVIYTPDIRTAGITLDRRTGFEADLVHFRGTLRVAGIPVFRTDLRRQEEIARPSLKPTAAKKSVPPAKTRRSTRERLAAVCEILPQAWRAIRNYLKGLYRATRIEDLSARIEAGFDSPDQTGELFGAYQAALATAPSIVSRVQFIPVWLGPAFRASGRLTVAIPMYCLVWRTMVLLWQFPTRKMIKGIR